MVCSHAMQWPSSYISTKMALLSRRCKQVSTSLPALLVSHWDQRCTFCNMPTAMCCITKQLSALASCMQQTQHVPLHPGHQTNCSIRMLLGRYHTAVHCTKEQLQAFFTFQIHSDLAQHCLSLQYFMVLFDTTQLQESGHTILWV